jgi:hypothetical protein
MSGPELLTWIILSILIVGAIAIMTIDPPHADHDA